MEDPGVELHVENRATHAHRVSSWLWRRWDECLSLTREAFSGICRPKEGRPPQLEWIEEHVTEERRDVEQEDEGVVAERRRLYFMGDVRYDPRFGVACGAPCVMSATVYDRKNS